MLTLLGLIEYMPPELLPRDASDFVKLVIRLQFLRGITEQWATLDASVSRVPGGDQNVICEIRDILAQCPDEAPTPGTTGLLFIPDPAFREGLRLDISTAEQALANGEWKAATVLAGSVVEALLLWAIQQAPAIDRQKAIASAINKGVLRQQPQGPPERWNPTEYIAVAEELTLIDDDTATQARLAKEFRNLIHPGRAQRLAHACDRGTAYAALAAFEMVVRCLTP
jgi:hypothetical protein